MKNIIEMRRKRAELLAQARTLADAENPSAEDLGKIQEMLAEADRSGAEIEVEERLQRTEIEADAAARGQEDPPPNPEQTHEFRSLGEFIQTVRFSPGDSRLVEAREMAMSDGASGGYLVPPAYSTQLLEVDTQAAIFRPRATVIPAGDLPDQGMTLPAVDYREGRYGGVEVAWIAEGVQKAETDAKLYEIKVEPKEVAAHVTLSDKLLRNAPAASALIEKLLRGAILASEDQAFYNGNGVGRPMGFLNHASALPVNRAVASQIAYTDVVSMLAAVKFGGPLAWIASQSIIPQLANMHDAGNHIIWQPSAREGMPSTLFGYPILWNERSAGLGSKGDLCLVDLSYYIVKDGFGIAVSASEHVYFRENKTVVKAFWNVDGQPWTVAPITLENGEEVSPFVVLDVPAA